MYTSGGSLFFFENFDPITFKLQEKVKKKNILMINFLLTVKFKVKNFYLVRYIFRVMGDITFVLGGHPAKSAPLPPPTTTFPLRSWCLRIIMYVYISLVTEYLTHDNMHKCILLDLFLPAFQVLGGGVCLFVLFLLFSINILRFYIVYKLGYTWCLRYIFKL